MIQVNFDQYRYFPTLRTRVAELTGLEMLDSARKRKTLPLLTLSKWPRIDDFAHSAERAAEAMGSDTYYFLDLPSDERHHTNSSKALLDPADAFRAWRSFVARQRQAIPVVQFAKRASQRDVVQQARRLEGAFGRLAFRIRDFSAETTATVAALSGMDDIGNAIIFVDVQYIRAALSAYQVAATTTIHAIRQQHPTALISVLSTSFPASSTAFTDSTQQHGRIEILERTLHQALGGNAVCLYGDYASIHAVVYDDQSTSKWSPRIDYPLEFEWCFERRSSAHDAASGYRECAAALIDVMPDIRRSDIWADRLIVATADGQPHGIAPQAWIPARVNLHLARQIDFSERIAQAGNHDEESMD